MRTLVQAVRIREASALAAKSVHAGVGGMIQTYNIYIYI